VAKEMAESGRLSLAVQKAQAIDMAKAGYNRGSYQW
jgi:hypothetical protein